MTGVVRLLIPDDVAQYRAMRLAALREHPEAFAASYEQDAGMDDAFFVSRLGGATAEAFAGTFGSFVDAVLVGITGMRQHPWPKMRHGAHVVSVYVDPAHRRGGYAGRLMDAVTAQARRLGLALLTLDVTVGNDRARRFYVARGFVSNGVARRGLLVNGRYYDEERMQLDLDTP